MVDSGEQFKGIDVAWLAVDSLGRVAIFTTAGFGPIPQSAVDSAGEVESWVAELTETSSHELLVPLPRPDDFIGFAARGLYAYDWQDLHRPMAQERKAYDLIALPSHPRLVSDLPPNLRQVAAATRLGCAFGDLHLSIPASGV